MTIPSTHLALSASLYRREPEAAIKARASAARLAPSLLAGRRDMSLMSTGTQPASNISLCK
jgi:hypothetical protein